MTPSQVVAMARGNSASEVIRLPRVIWPRASYGITFIQFTNAKKSTLVPTNMRASRRCGMT